MYKTIKESTVAENYLEVKKPIELLKSLEGLVGDEFPSTELTHSLDNELEKLPYLGLFHYEDLSWLDEIGLINYWQVSNEIKRFRREYIDKLHVIFFSEKRTTNLIKRAIKYCKQNWPCGIVRTKSKENLSYSDSLSFNYKLVVV